MNHRSRLVPATIGIFALTVLSTLVADIWLDVDYRLAANIALLFAAVGVTGFTLLYGFRSKWRSNRIGRVYLVKCIVFSVVLLQIVAASWIDEDFAFRQQIRFAIYLAGALVYIPMLISLWREQQRDRRLRGELDDINLPPGVPPL